MSSATIYAVMARSNSRERWAYKFKSVIFKSALQSALHWQQSHWVLLIASNGTVYEFNEETAEFEVVS